MTKINKMRTFLILLLCIAFLLIISASKSNYKFHENYVLVNPIDTGTEYPLWQEGRYFPVFNSADTIYSFRVECSFTNATNRNWRINQSDQITTGLTLATMQGLINRGEARVYLQWDEPTNQYGVDSYPIWINKIKSVVKVIELDFEGEAAITYLLQKFSNCFNGLVIYDPEVPETINLATMIGGLENRIVVGPHQLNWQGIEDISDRKDLRQLVVDNGWEATFDSQLEIYQWVYDSLWPELDHRMIGFTSAGPPTSIDRETGQDGFYFAIGIAHKDYEVALKMPVLYLNPKYADHLELLEKFFQEAETPIAVTGPPAFNEDGMVTLASKYGNFLSATSWPGQVLSCGNLTVLSAIRPEIIPAKPDIDPDHILATIHHEGPISTLFNSDGDALFFQMDRGFIPFFEWDDLRGQPFNWETNPLLSEIAPVIWNYYQENRGPTSSIAGISGAGYARPQLMDSTELKAYLSRADKYLNETGVRVLRIDGNGGPVNEMIARLYYQELQESDYLGAILSFQPSSNAGYNLQYFGNPTPILQETFTINAVNKWQIMEELLNKTPNLLELEITTPGNVPEVQEVADDSASGKNAVMVDKAFVSSPSYSLIYSSGPVTLEPGDYSITHRLKVSDNSSSEQVANLYAGVDFTNPNWVFLNGRSVAADEFEAQDQYQDFTYQFSIENLTQQVEFRIDYGNGGSDLWLDVLRIENSSEDILPVYAPLYMSLGIDPSLFDGMNTLAKDFSNAFTMAGGLILTANEFFASLNPEFMIAFAEQQEHDDSLLNLAKSQFEDDQFYLSLINARKSLKNTFTSTDEINLSTDQPFQISVSPNPFTDQLSLQIQLKKASTLSVYLYNSQGILVNDLLKRKYIAGPSTFNFQVQLPPGIYFCVARTNDYSTVQKLIRF